ncbi:hypothetical protein QJS04_geneDACA000286 [Acorus gramineus]|uniref:Uncharacterized protein n=1 Tax=Acorus gramineus TaxID=55184 RepID=A0AAV9AQF0_ACOGR|nr:hypothetical protein QJS04_geneDACA000286 [Acorus gramineus]
MPAEAEEEKVVVEGEALAMVLDTVPEAAPVRDMVVLKVVGTEAAEAVAVEAERAVVRAMELEVGAGMGQDPELVVEKEEAVEVAEVVVEDLVVVAAMGRAMGPAAGLDMVPELVAEAAVEGAAAEVVVEVGLVLGQGPAMVLVQALDTAVGGTLKQMLVFISGRCESSINVFNVDGHKWSLSDE